MSSFQYFSPLQYQNIIHFSICRNFNLNEEKTERVSEITLSESRNVNWIGGIFFSIFDNKCSRQFCLARWTRMKHSCMNQHSMSERKHYKRNEEKMDSVKCERRKCVCHIGPDMNFMLNVYELQVYNFMCAKMLRSHCKCFSHSLTFHLLIYSSVHSHTFFLHFSFIQTMALGFNFFFLLMLLVWFALCICRANRYKY